MLNVLMFIFGSFWRWAGFTVILIIVFTGIFDIVKVIGASICSSIEASHAIYTKEEKSEETEESSDDSEDEED